MINQDARRKLGLPRERGTKERGRDVREFKTRECWRGRGRVEGGSRGRENNIFCRSGISRRNIQIPTSVRATILEASQLRGKYREREEETHSARSSFTPSPSLLPLFVNCEETDSLFRGRGMFIRSPRLFNIPI